MSKWNLVGPNHWRRELHDAGFLDVEYHSDVRTLTHTLVADLSGTFDLLPGVPPLKAASKRTAAALRDLADRIER